MMRIALLGLEDNFSRSTGLGAPVYMYELYNHLKKLSGSNDFDVEKIEYERVSAGDIKIFNEGLGWLWLVLKSAVEDYSSFDILHKVDIKPIFPYNRGNAIFVTTAHDFQPILAPELDSDMENSIGNRLKLSLEIRYSLRLALRSDFLMTNTTLTRDDAVSLGFDKKKIFIAPHGIDERYRNQIKKRKNKEYTVGYIGSFRYRKNLQFAIKAFAKTEGKVRFEVWGKKAYDYRKLEFLARNDKRINFMGFAPEDKIVSIYDGFDAFVFPSFYEGEGLPILEAQARGLPVVIYKKGKIANEIKKYCYEAEDEEEMTEIITKLKEEGYNNKRREAAIKYARSFTWENTARKTLEAYEKMIRIK